MNYPLRKNTLQVIGIHQIFVLSLLIIPLLTLHAFIPSHIIYILLWGHTMVQAQMMIFLSLTKLSQLSSLQVSRSGNATSLFCSFSLSCLHLDVIFFRYVYGLYLFRLLPPTQSHAQCFPFVSFRLPPLHKGRTSNMESRKFFSSSRPHVIFSFSLGQLCQAIHHLGCPWQIPLSHP